MTWFAPACNITLFSPCLKSFPSELLRLFITLGNKIKCMCLKQKPLLLLVERLVEYIVPSCKETCFLSKNSHRIRIGSENTQGRIECITHVCDGMEHG